MRSGRTRLRCGGWRTWPPRLDGQAVAVVVAERATPATRRGVAVSAIRSVAVSIRPTLLDAAAAATLVRHELGPVSDAQCAVLWRSSGGNPFYLGELIRSRRAADRDDGERYAPADPPSDVVGHIRSRIDRLDPDATILAGALAVLGDGCRLRHAAALTGMQIESVARLAADLVAAEVLSVSDPPCFLHPIVRTAVESSVPADEQRRLHRAAADQLSADGAAPAHVAAHLMRVSPGGDAWVADRLRRAARVAIASGDPIGAGTLLRRAVDEPPARPERVAVLRELAAADVAAGRDTAVRWLEGRPLAHRGPPVARRDRTRSCPDVRCVFSLGGGGRHDRSRSR